MMFLTSLTNAITGVLRFSHLILEFLFQCGYFMKNWFLFFEFAKASILEEKSFDVAIDANYGQQH
jgi:hypothetical protein